MRLPYTHWLLPFVTMTLAEGASVQERALTEALEQVGTFSPDRVAAGVEILDRAGAREATNQELAGLRFHFETLSEAQGRLQAAQADLNQVLRTSTERTLSQNRVLIPEKERVVAEATGQMRRALGGAGRFARDLYRGGHSPQAERFLAVLKALAARSEIEWYPVKLDQGTESPLSDGATEELVIGELTVKRTDGSDRVLREVTLREVKGEEVSLAHAGGFASVPLAGVPEPYRSLWEAKRPKPDPPKPVEPEPVPPIAGTADQPDETGSGAEKPGMEEGQTRQVPEPLKGIALETGNTLGLTLDDLVRCFAYPPNAENPTLDLMQRNLILGRYVVYHFALFGGPEAGGLRMNRFMNVGQKAVFELADYFEAEGHPVDPLYLAHYEFLQNLQGLADRTVREASAKTWQTIGDLPKLGIDAAYLEQIATLGMAAISMERHNAMARKSRLALEAHLREAYPADGAKMLEIMKASRNFDPALFEQPHFLEWKREHYPDAKMPQRR